MLPIHKYEFLCKCSAFLQYYKQHGTETMSFEGVKCYLHYLGPQEVHTS